MADSLLADLLISSDIAYFDDPVDVFATRADFDRWLAVLQGIVDPIAD